MPVIQREGAICDWLNPALGSRAPTDSEEFEQTAESAHNGRLFWLPLSRHEHARFEHGALKPTSLRVPVRDGCKRAPIQDDQLARDLL